MWDMIVNIFHLIVFLVTMFFKTIAAIFLGLYGGVIFLGYGIVFMLGIDMTALLSYAIFKNDEDPFTSLKKALRIRYTLAAIASMTFVFLLVKSLFLANNMSIWESLVITILMTGVVVGSGVAWCFFTHDFVERQVYQTVLQTHLAEIRQHNKPLVTQTMQQVSDYYSNHRILPSDAQRIQHFLALAQHTPLTDDDVTDLTQQIYNREFQDPADEF